VTAFGAGIISGVRKLCWLSGGNISPVVLELGVVTMLRNLHPYCLKNCKTSI